MTAERLKRLITAGVAGAVSVLVILLTVLVYQMVCLNQAKKELDAWVKAEQEYLQLKEDTENQIILWLEDWKVEEAARKYGFRKKS